MEKKDWIYGSLILLLILTLLFFTLVDLDEFGDNAKRISEGIILPECYVAKTDRCALTYHRIDMIGSFGSGFIQCCRGNEYLLQGIDVDLLNHYMGGNTWTKSIFDVYNCSFDISRKLHCTDVNDCYDRPNLEGCYRDADDCNWCCDGWCTLVACITLDGLGINLSE